MARLINIFLCALVAFILIAFVEAKINPFEWLWVSRFIFVLTWIGLCYVDWVTGKKSKS